MIEELSQIDTSSIHELHRMKTEEDALQERLDKMEEMKGKVSDIVFQRVHQDYNARYAAMEKEARPLRQKARSEYAKLLQHHAHLESAVEAARFDIEELDFRRNLGEFTDEEHNERLESMAGSLEDRESHLEKSDKLRTTFLEAFRSEEELLRAGREPAPVDDQAKNGSGEADASAEKSEETVEKSDSGDLAGDATMIIPPATLIVQAGDGSGNEIQLGLQPLNIGRASDNDLCLDVRGVSRHHAEISVAENGFQIRDSHSRKGLYVNGVQISSRVLEDGDLIELGSSQAQLIFRVKG